MSRGYDSEPGRSHARAAPTTAATSERVSQVAPADHAAASIAAFTRTTHRLPAAIAALRGAHGANDLERWTAQRSRVEALIAEADRGLERALAQIDEATPAMREQLEVARHELVDQRAVAQTLDVPPSGYSALACEMEVLAIFEAPLVGGAQLGYQRKQLELQAAIDEMTTVDRRALVDRLRRRRPGDPIAAAFGRLTEARRNTLLQYLASAAKRDAQQREQALRRGAADHGVADANASMPHLAAIQKSFGKHDVTNVKSAVGGSAAAASDALDASAYAVGDRIAFRSEPDLHTAAHEAAHVVQQRAGYVPAGGIDSPGDHLERHADRVADTVVAGASAEALLDQLGGGTPAAAIQRAPAARAAAGARPAAREELPDLGTMPYVIEPGGRSALIRTSWVTVGNPVDNMVEVLHRMQHLGAFPWAKPEGLRKAAAHTDIQTTARTIRYDVGLRTFAMMGLPPLDSAMVARTADGLEVAFRAGNLGDESDAAYSLGPEDIAAVYDALEKRTQLTRRKRIALVGAITIRAEIVMLEISDAQLTEIFGAKEWLAWKDKHPAGGEATGESLTVASELTFRERMRVEAFFRDKLKLASTGKATRLDRSLLQLVDEVEADPTLIPAIRSELDKGAESPGAAVDQLNLRELIDKARFERDRAQLGFAAPADVKQTGALTGFDIAARIKAAGLLTPDRSITLSVDLGWDELRAALAFSPEAFAKFRNTDWHVQIEWAFERTDVAGHPRELAKSDGLSVDHTFKLGPQETRGHWMVHALMRSSHFPAKHITLPLDVETEDQRMSTLRDEAMGDMKPATATWTPHRFDTGVRDDIARQIDPRQVHKTLPGAGDPDRDGFEIHGALPAGWKTRSAAERAKQRGDEITRYQKMIAYLEEEQASGKVGYQDAINAATERLQQLRDADRAVTADTSGRARPFELRGTYFNRNGDAPASGALDLYATVAMQKIDGSIEYEVKIRDLSNKVAANLEVSGHEVRFDDALRMAFVDLCKAYPDGKMTILGEELRANAGNALQPTGKMLGFELATTSSWKKLRSTVYDPVVQNLLNAAAMAVMIVFPPSAAVIVPVLAVTDIVNNVDDIVTRHASNTLHTKELTYDLAAIGLDLLPALRSAKAFHPARATIDELKGASWRLVAFDVGNFAGQTLVMAEKTRDALAEIQEQQIGALGERYRELLKLQDEHPNPSDPRLAEKRAEIEADAKAIRDATYTTWTTAVAQHTTFMVGTRLLGPHTAGQHDDPHATNEPSGAGKTRDRRPHEPPKPDTANPPPPPRELDWATTPAAKRVVSASRRIGHDPESIATAQREALINADNAYAHHDVEGAHEILGDAVHDAAERAKWTSALEAGHTLEKGRKPLRTEDGAYYDGPTAKTSEILMTQDWVSPKTSTTPEGKPGIPLPELADIMERTGWRGSPLDVVEKPNGDVASIDHRRVVAARMANEQAEAKHAGTPLPELPVNRHKWNDPFPPVGWPDRRADAFKLERAIYEKADGTLYAEGGGTGGTLKYEVGVPAKTWGQAALFRAAKQGESLRPELYPDTHGYFPVEGTKNTPKIGRKGGRR